MPLFPGCSHVGIFLGVYPSSNHWRLVKWQVRWRVSIRLCSDCLVAVYDDRTISSSWSHIIFSSNCCYVTLQNFYWIVSRYNNCFLKKYFPSLHIILFYFLGGVKKSRPKEMSRDTNNELPCCIRFTNTRLVKDQWL